MQLKSIAQSPVDESKRKLLQMGDYIRVLDDDTGRGGLDARVMEHQISPRWVKLHFGNDRDNKRQHAKNGCAVICSRIEEWNANRLDFSTIKPSPS